VITEMYVEQLNPNDTEFRVILQDFTNGDKVEQGQLLFELEGQKTVFEVASEHDGFIYSLYELDDYIAVEDAAYYIYDDEIELNELIKNTSNNDSMPKCDEVEVLKTNDEIVTLKKIHSPYINLAVLPGGKAYRQIEDAIAGSQIVKLVGFFDDAERTSIDKLGAIDFDLIQSLWKKGVFDRVFVATGDSRLRTKLLNMLTELGIKVMNIIHPTAYISNSASIGSNVFIGPKASIGAKSIVGNGCFLSAFANVEHHCYLNENILLGPGVMLSGSVKVGARTVLASGVAVESNIVIGKDVFVGVGLGVSTHLKDSQRVIS